ncbi:hypothetical protein [Paenibacillus sp. IITD108]|uniref:hypothetical protein n=1 Tax=Paenibacillus sp. IITD108 TaxID=3116649 RepID=UPI002F415E94
MSWTWKKILGFGITGLLIMTLIFAPATGLIAKVNNSHAKAVQRVDDTTDSYAK